MIMCDWMHAVDLGVLLYQPLSMLQVMYLVGGFITNKRLFACFELGPPFFDRLAETWWSILPHLATESPLQEGCPRQKGLWSLKQRLKQYYRESKLESP